MTAHTISAQKVKLLKFYINISKIKSQTPVADVFDFEHYKLCVPNQ